jgi:hypothetical protein
MGERQEEKIGLAVVGRFRFADSGGYGIVVNEA